MTNEPIGWTVTWDLKDREAFKALAKETAQAVEKAEPETVLYEWCVSEDGAKVTLLEWFSGLTGAKAHLNGIAVSKYLPKLNGLGNLTAIHVYGNVDQELRGMLVGLKPAGIHKEFCGFNRLAVPATPGLSR